MQPVADQSPRPLIAPVNGKTPRVDPSALVAPGASVLGDVELGPGVSVWFGCVLRGDINWIRVGAESNLQDGTVVHVAHRGPGTLVGSQVVVGHRVVLHSCTVADRVLVGMGAVILDRATVEEGAVVAAGAVVPPGAVIPAGHLAAGVPAKVVRPLSPEELDRTRAIKDRYLRVQGLYRDPELVIDFAEEG
jgi:carbonic anhydrase/acetyltransferase-like protein (isoleucine patch superfamily)